MSRRRTLGIVVAALVASSLGAACCGPQLIASSITPGDPFDATQTPPAPHYADDTAWLALPERSDEADVALADDRALPLGRARVDVFYVHSTSSIAPRWNAAVDDPEVRAASIRGGTLIQASVFNACCAIYAPEYRQASGDAFVNVSASGDRAIDVAYADVAAAFASFLVRVGPARPFVIAGHSQGAVLLMRLLRERIAPGPERARLVAAYLIGAPVTAAAIAPLQACTAPTAVGCVVTYNARGPEHVATAFDFGRAVDESARLCVNPTRGAATSERVPRTAHGGAVFFDSDAPALLPHFAASTCRAGRLVLEDVQPLPPRDVMSGILLWVMGGQNFHPIEYQLFYRDLRNDAVTRAGAALATTP